MTTQEQRTEYRQRIEAARHQLTPERAWDWEGDQLTDALMAVDIVANTVMNEAKKNPVQAQPGFLWEPPTNRYLFVQTMHDVGRAVMDKLIGAGWVPPSRMSASENVTPHTEGEVTL